MRPQKVEYDIYYVQHVNPWLDLKLMVFTAFRLVRESFTAAGNAPCFPRMTTSKRNFQQRSAYRTTTWRGAVSGFDGATNLHPRQTEILQNSEHRWQPWNGPFAWPALNPATIRPLSPGLFCSFWETRLHAPVRRTFLS